MWRTLKNRLSLWIGREKPNLGSRGERAAARYLQRNKIKVVEKNVRFREGELDLVAVDGRVVVFVEVKTRNSREKGEPWEAVDHAKQQRIIELARIYLRQEDLEDQEVRFDIVSIVWPDTRKHPEIEHLKGAFADDQNE